MKKGEKRVYFSKVKEAREALAEESVNIVRDYMSFIKDAWASQEFDVANEAFQFLLRHLPKGEDDETVVDPNIDKDVKGGRLKELPAGPTIQIGIALGTPKPKKELAPAEVIDVTDDE